MTPKRNMKSKGTDRLKMSSVTWFVIITNVT